MNKGAVLPSVLTAAPRPFLFRRPVADLWLRPWFDWYGLRFISRFFFPVSRAWARAAEAGCDEAAFRDSFGLARGDRSGLGEAVARVGEAARRHAEQQERWREGFFGRGEQSPAALVSLERERAQAAFAFMALQRLFAPWRRRLPPAAWEVAGQEEVAFHHGSRRGDPASAYPLHAGDEIAESQAAPATWGELSWLSFRSPVLGDRVTARVETPPARGGSRPTLILLHGIAMEDEMWGARPDPFDRLRDAGWRIVKPEGPWHGRRRLPGRYGGEPVIAWGLDGFLTLFQAWVAETALLIDWARRQGDGPVVLGGISLGALTAQLFVSRTQAWPAALTPDALFLLATSGAVGAAAYDGALARALGVPQRLAERGWTMETLEPWLGLIEPGASAVPPERIVMLLGRTDSVTPYDEGSLLAERWQVPRQNLFRPWQGHFSVSVGLTAFPKPLDRLRQVVEAPRLA